MKVSFMHFYVSLHLLCAVCIPIFAHDQMILLQRCVDKTPKGLSDWGIVPVSGKLDDYEVCKNANKSLTGSKLAFTYEYDGDTFCCLNAPAICTNGKDTSYLSNPLATCYSEADCLDGQCISGLCCTKFSGTEHCPSSNLPGTDCASDNDCSSADSQKYNCLSLSSKSELKKKFCCDLPQEQLCGGVLHPYSSPEGSLLWQTACNISIAYELNKIGNSRSCCRKPFLDSLISFGIKRTPSIRENTLLPVPCDDASTCSEGEHCASSSYIVSDGETRVDTMQMKFTSAPRKFCYKTPVCAGKTLVLGDGPKTCLKNDHCPSDYFCDIDMFHEGFGLSKNSVRTGICCQYMCPEIKNLSMILEGSFPETQFGFVRPNKTQGQNLQRFCNSAYRFDGKKSLNLLCCDYPQNTKEQCPREWNATKILVDGNIKVCETNSDCSTNPTKSAVCFKNNRNTKGFCCELKMCEDGNTVPYLENNCTTPSDCHQPRPESAVCMAGVNHCCPKMKNGLVEHTYRTNQRCESNADCGYGLKYCENGYCWLLGKNDAKTITKQTCASQDDCNNRYAKGVCITEIARSLGYCFLHPFGKAYDNTKLAHPLYKVLGLSCGILSFIFGLIAVVCYLKYRSRHLCEFRRLKADDEQDKKRKK